MAKRICPYCKEKVKSDAVICKHCKSNLPPLPPKKWYQTWGGFLLIIFILAIFVRIFNDSAEKSTYEQKQNIQTAEEKKAKYIGPKEWTTYFKDSVSESSYKDIVIVDEKIREVMSVLEIGQACVYNHYRFNCKENQWLQIEVAALPCGIPFEMKPGPKFARMVFFGLERDKQRNN